MARLVIVSNRVANPKESAARAGGLAVALRDMLYRESGVWFGWSGEITEETPEQPALHTDKNVTFATLDLGQSDYNDYYIGYANSTLWPVFHYRVDLIAYQEKSYDGYVRVNETFARALAPLLEPDDVIWVHDYHLIPLGAALRRLGVKNPIGFFLHIPFPSVEVFTTVPRHEVLMADLLTYDLIGVQTESDRESLFTYIRHEADGAVSDNGTAFAYGRSARVEAFPIGIDTQQFVEFAEAAATAQDTTRLLESIQGRPSIIGVDRLDISKGIDLRFRAYAALLRGYPELRREVVYLQIAPPSRMEVEEYRKLRDELQALAGQINSEFGEIDWVPLRYMNKSYSRQNLAGFYRVSRVGLVTPMRDGMNLVAKEYVAAQDPEDPGVLIISRFAGAANELDGALKVNPFDLDQVANSMAQALLMSKQERLERWQSNMAVISENTVANWADRFLKELERVPAQG